MQAKTEHDIAYNIFNPYELNKSCIPTWARLEAKIKIHLDGSPQARGTTRVLATTSQAHATTLGWGCPV
jgi:hypothetical protein